MKHLDEGVLLALLDDEIAPDEARAARGHLEGCGECREACAHLEGEAGIFAAAVAVVDREPHLLEARAAISRRRRPLPLRRSFVRAAVLVLAAAGVASATVPGSPVRDWLRALIAPAPPAAPPGVEAPPPPAEPVELAPREAGISILPAAGAVRVVLEDASGGVRVRVRLTSEPRAEVRARGAAAAARFATAEGVVHVIGVHGGDLEVAFPRDVTRATVELEGIILLYKDGDALHLSPSAGRIGEVRVVVDD